MVIILGEDFNVDFAKGISKPLVDFFTSVVDLKLYNDPNKTTTKYETTDGGFYRYLANFLLTVFISYFHFHKPIVSFSGYDTNDHYSEQSLPKEFINNYNYTLT